MAMNKIRPLVLCVIFLLIIDKLTVALRSVLCATRDHMEHLASPDAGAYDAGLVEGPLTAPISSEYENRGWSLPRETVNRVPALI